MKLTKIFVLAFFSSAFFSCGENNTCGAPAKVIYNLGFPNCEFFVEINEAIYEPSNISDWSNFIYYVDTQNVYIDYQFTNEFSTCSGLEKIDIYCLTNI